MEWDVTGDVQGFEVPLNGSVAELRQRACSAFGANAASTVLCVAGTSAPLPDATSLQDTALCAGEHLSLRAVPFPLVRSPYDCYFEKYLWSFALSSCGQLCYIGYDDATIATMDTVTGELRALPFCVAKPNTNCSHLAVSPCLAWVYVIMDDTLVQMDTTEGRSQSNEVVFSYGTAGLAAAQDRVFVLHMKGVTVYDSALREVLQVDRPKCACFAVSRCGEVLATVGEGGLDVLVHNVSVPGDEKVLMSECDLGGVAISPCGTQLAVQEPGEISLFSLEDYTRTPFTVDQDAGYGSVLHFTPDGRTLLSICRATVYQYCIRTGSLLHTVRGCYEDIVISACSRHVLFESDEDNMLAVRDLHHWDSD